MAGILVGPTLGFFCPDPAVAARFPGTVTFRAGCCIGIARWNGSLAPAGIRRSRGGGRSSRSPYLFRLCPGGNGGLTHRAFSGAGAGSGLTARTAGHGAVSSFGVHGGAIALRIRRGVGRAGRNGTPARPGIGLPGGSGCGQVSTLRDCRRRDARRCPAA